MSGSMEDRNFESMMRETHKRLTVDGAERNRAASALFASAKEPVKGNWAFRGMWLLTAAAVIFVVFNSLHSEDRKTRQGAVNRHFTQSVKDLGGCRFVGIFGDTAVIEVEEGGESKQIKLKKGAEFKGFKVKDFGPRHIRLETQSGDTFLLSMRGEAIAELKEAKPGYDLEKGQFLISGKVTKAEGNFLGEPYIYAKDNEGNLCGHASPNVNGNYRILLEKEVAELSLYIGAINVTEKGPWKTTAVVDFDLSKANFITLKGNILENKDWPASFSTGLTVFGAKGKYLTSDYQAKPGKPFTVKAQETIDALLYKQEEISVLIRGPWTESKEFDIDLSKYGLNTLTATVLGLDGKPMKGLFPVSIFDADHSMITIRNTGEEGSVTFKTNVEVASAELLVNGHTIVKEGPWKTGGNIEFDLSKEKGQFKISGIVQGQDGKPAAGATIWPLTVEDKIPSHVTSDKNGRYELNSFSGIKTMYARIGNLTMSLNGPWKTESTVDFDFGKLKATIIEGSVLGLDGKALTSNMATVTAYGAEGSLPAYGVVQNGKYKIETTHEILKLELKLVGAAITQIKEGNWEGRHSVDFNLRDTKAFEIKGLVKGTDGKPLRIGNITAYDEKGEKLVVVTLNFSGTYSIQTNITVARLELSLGHGKSAIVKREGSWSKNAEENFELPAEMQTIISGNILGADGKGAVGVVFSAHGIDGTRLGFAGTDAAGAFEIKVVGVIAELRYKVGGKDLVEEGNWKGGDNKLNINLDKKGFFCIEGLATGMDGKPLTQAAVYAYSEKNVLLASTFTDDKGRYTLSVEGEVKKIRVAKGMDNFDTEGSWKAKSTVDFNLKKEGYFEIKGEILGADGKPMLNLNVSALDDAGNLLKKTITGVAHNPGFTMQVAKAVSKIKIECGFMQFEVKGLWKEGNEVKIDLRDHGLFRVTGKLIGLDGKPMQFAVLQGFDENGGALTGQANKDGDYEILANRKIVEIRVGMSYAPTVASFDANFEKNGTLDIDLSRAKLPVYTGKALDASGKGIMAKIVCLDKNGKSICSAMSDKEGKFTLQCNLPVAKMQMTYIGKTATVELTSGTGGAEVTLQLK